MVSIEPALLNLGWRERVTAELSLSERLARIVEQHRYGYLVDDGIRQFPARTNSKFDRKTLETTPAVGDWVTTDDGDPGLILSILPRRSLLKRLAAGHAKQWQILASNIDYAFIACGLDRDFNLKRIERYLALAEDGGTSPVVVLTKKDLCGDPAARVGETESYFRGKYPVICVNAKSAESRDLFAPYLKPGDTAVLLGSSGVGKSTLINTLIGSERQKTKAVRAKDHRGKHTTTRRSLMKLPSGACLIDCPGLREIKLALANDGPLPLFDEIESLASACKFSDCRHDSEPHCAVKAALAQGKIDEARFAHYRKLLAGEAGNTPKSGRR